MNFNTILGEIYGMDFDEISSDYRGESQLFIKKKTRQNPSGTSLYPRHLSLHIFVPIILIFPYIFVIKFCGGVLEY